MILITVQLLKWYVLQADKYVKTISETGASVRILGSSVGADKYAKTTSETGASVRILGSSVGAVLQHDNDDEEYDPRRPAIGNVASVVKVTERRYDAVQYMTQRYTTCAQ